MHATMKDLTVNFDSTRKDSYRREFDNLEQLDVSGSIIWLIIRSAAFAYVEERYGNDVEGDTFVVVTQEPHCSK